MNDGKENLAINAFQRKSPPCVRETLKKDSLSFSIENGNRNHCALTTFVICIDFHTKEEKKVTHPRHTVMAKTQIDVLKDLRFIGLESNLGLKLAQKMYEKEPKIALLH